MTTEEELIKEKLIESFTRASITTALGVVANTAIKDLVAPFDLIEDIDEIIDSYTNIVSKFNEMVDKLKKESIH